MSPGTLHHHKGPLFTASNLIKKMVPRTVDFRMNAPIHEPIEAHTFTHIYK